MILPPPDKKDFEFKRDVRVDVDNQGFTPEEMQKLAGPMPSEAMKGMKGPGDFLKTIFAPGRKVPPELKNLKSDFGYQTQPMLTDLIAVAEKQHTELDGTIQARAPKYNFYVMRCGVYIAPEGGETFEALKFKVRYKGDAASTYSMLPGPQAKKLLVIGGTASVGVNGKAEFGIPEVKVPHASASASAKAELETKFIVSFEYELKAQILDAFGVGNPFCSWLMHKGNSLRNDVVFYPVIMTPKNVTAFDCEFTAYFKINHSDWKNPEFFLKPVRTIRLET
jgi:hypothetical protein